MLETAIHFPVALIYLLSLMFAIAQYYDSRQRKEIEDMRDKTEDAAFEYGNVSSEIRKLREDWESLQNIQHDEFKTTQNVIIYLWFSISFYSLSFAFFFILPCLQDSSLTKWLGSSIVIIEAIFRFLAMAQIIIGVTWLTKNLMAMKKQLRHFRRIYKAVTTFTNIVNSIK